MAKETGSGHGCPGLWRLPASSCGQSNRQSPHSGQTCTQALASPSGHSRPGPAQTLTQRVEREQALPSPQNRVRGHGAVGCLPTAHQAVRLWLGTCCLSHQVTCGQEMGQAGPAPPPGVVGAMRGPALSCPCSGTHTATSLCLSGLRRPWYLPCPPALSQPQAGCPHLPIWV